MTVMLNIGLQNLNNLWFLAYIKQFRQFTNYKPIIVIILGHLVYQIEIDNVQIPNSFSILLSAQVLIAVKN